MMAPARMVSIDARPGPLTMDLARVAVLVIDMQNDFAIQGGIFGRAGIPRDRSQPVHVTPAGGATMAVSSSATAVRRGEDDAAGRPHRSRRSARGPCRRRHRGVPQRHVRGTAHWRIAVRGRQLRRDRRLDHLEAGQRAKPFGQPCRRIRDQRQIDPRDRGFLPRRRADTGPP